MERGAQFRRQHQASTVSLRETDDPRIRLARPSTKGRRGSPRSLASASMATLPRDTMRDRSSADSGVFEQRRAIGARDPASELFAAERAAGKRRLPSRSVSFSLRNVIRCRVR
jgi:hypothetical protein